MEIHVILLLLVIGVLVYFIYKKNKPTTTTTTTKSLSTSTTTKSLVYYSLYKCEPNGIDYYTGPLPVNTFSSGQMVEGTTDTFYVVKTSQTLKPSGRHIDVSNTINMGC